MTTNGIASRHCILVAFALLTTTCLWTPDANAQNASIRGLITGEADGQPLPGATVVLWRGGEAAAGAAADADGFYVIKGLDPGSYLIRASFVGYAVYEDSLRVRPGEDMKRDFVLKDAAAALGEVVVEAGTVDDPIHLDAGLPITGTRFEIELIPAPDVSGDLANFLAAQPGILTSGDRGGQLFVQGGEATQNLVLLDGMPIFQPFHLVGFFSAFPADIIAQADFYGAGFGARYGGRLSSVIDISTRGGSLTRFGGAASAAPFMSSLSLEGPIVPKRASFLVSVRQSMIEEAASHLTKRSLPFEFGDRFAKLHVAISGNSILSVNALQTFDRGILHVDEDERNEIEWQSDAVGIRHLLIPTHVPMRAEVTGYYSRLSSTLGGEESERSSSMHRIGAGANATVYTNLFDLHWGAFVGTSSLEYSLSGLFQNYESGADHVTDAGLYVAPEFIIAQQLHVSAGVRIHTFPSKKKTFAEPRLSAVWQRGIHRLHASSGVYHQQLVGLADKRDPANVFTVWTASPVGEVPSSKHLAFGYRLRPYPWLEASARAFFKTSRDVQVAKWTPVPSFTPEIEPVDASADGLEFQVNLRRSSYNVSVGYGFSDVWYDSQRQRLSEWFGPLRYWPPHNRRHKLSLLAAADLQGFGVSVRWQYGSGTSYSRPLGFDEFILMEGAVDPFTETGTRRIIYGEPYANLLPSYHRLDVSVDRTFTWKRASLTLHGALINAYDRANILYMDLYTGRRVDQLPLFPSVGIKVAFQ